MAAAEVERRVPPQRLSLANLAKVAKLADARARLLLEIEGGSLGVTINAKFQDDVIVEACRPIVLGELRNRIRSIERDLEALGVEVG
ncbi:MAG: hypothetical protein ABW194_11555 [Novosphingobium sp.]